MKVPGAKPSGPGGPKGKGPKGKGPKGLDKAEEKAEKAEIKDIRAEIKAVENFEKKLGNGGFLPPGLAGKDLPPGNPFSGRTQGYENDDRPPLAPATNTPATPQVNSLAGNNTLLNNAVFQQPNALTPDLGQGLTQGANLGSIPGLSTGTAGIGGLTPQTGLVNFGNPSPNILGSNALVPQPTSTPGVFQPFSAQNSPFLAPGPPGIIEGVSRFFLAGDAAGGILQLFNNVEANSANRLNQLNRLLAFAPIV